MQWNYIWRHSGRTENVVWLFVAMRNMKIGMTNTSKPVMGCADRASPPYYSIVGGSVIFLCFYIVHLKAQCVTCTRTYWHKLKKKIHACFKLYKATKTVVFSFANNNHLILHKKRGLLWGGGHNDVYTEQGSARDFACMKSLNEKDVGSSGTS